MTDRDKIKAFVQNVLGCGCSEEVFRIIEKTGREHKGTGYSRINIGNRLLVYLFRTEDRQFILDEMSQLVKAGVADRDENGFNRFRLAFAMERPAAAGPLVGKAFSSLTVDDRTYLHIVDKDQADF